MWSIYCLFIARINKLVDAYIHARARISKAKMNENDENVDPMRDVGDMYDKLLVEIGEEVFGLDALEVEIFDGLRHRYIDQLIEEIEEDLRRDFEMDDEDEDEDEDDPYDNDEMEPDPPRQPA